MAQERPVLNAFNRGIVSPDGLARVEVDRIRLSAEQQHNWLPRVLGSMDVRPGTQYIGTCADVPYILPFIFGKSDTAWLEFHDASLCVWVDEERITRETVSTTIANGGFAADLTSWTDADEAGAASTWSNTGAYGATGGYAKLTGTGYASAILRQTLTVAAPDQNVEHALRIIIESGPVTLRIGSTSGGEEYVRETQLWTGEHSIAWTPTGDTYVEISNIRKAPSYVASIAIEDGLMTLTSPYTTDDLLLIRPTQSADIVFLACEGMERQRVERRATRSWSIVKDQPEDGPFRSENRGPINISSSAISGAVTLTATKRFFKSGHVGALFRIDSLGQEVTQSVSGENQWSDPIRVTGTEDAEREFTITRSGTWTATVTLQRSVAEPGAWTDVTTYTTNGATVYADGLEDQIIWYRIGVDAGDYTSGPAVLTLTYPNGSISGIARVVQVATELEATAHVLKDLGGTEASSLWSEGEWSTLRGFPSALSLFEARMWTAGKGKVWGSVVDDYISHDDEFEGDAGPISRSIGEGPIDNVNWVMPMQRLVISTDMEERSAKASSLDDPLTPTSFSLKRISSQGSKRINPISMDDMGVFVNAGGTKCYALKYNTDSTVTTDYAPEDLMALVPDLCDDDVEIRHLAFQRQPDTRILATLTDGTAAWLIFDRTEDVKAWVTIDTDGEILQFFMLPGSKEDLIYWVVQRENGTFIEKQALRSECQGGTNNKLLDSHVIYSGASTATITGLDHLEGESVYAWANGDQLGPFTVSGGQVSLGVSTTWACVGLTYRARFKSSRLAYGSARPLGHTHISAEVALILGRAHRSGLRFGPDFDHLDRLPSTTYGAPVTADFSQFDETAIALAGSWDTDQRLCLQIDAPKHCNVRAAIVTIVV